MSFNTDHAILRLPDKIMGNLLSAKPQQAPTVPTDTIIPVSCFDDNAINRSVLLYVTLRFDHVLDAEKLRSSFERLMELGHWRKLGARVRNAVRILRKFKLEWN